MIADIIHTILGTNVNTGSCANLTDGTNPITLYHHNVPQTLAAAYVVWVDLGKGSTYKKGGPQMREHSISFVCYHTKDTLARTVADNLEALVEGYRGTSGGSTVHYVTHERTVDNYNAEMRLFYYTVDFNFSIS